MWKHYAFTTTNRKQLKYCILLPVYHPPPIQNLNPQGLGFFYWLIANEVSY
jgi:hypothetical protein